MTLLFHVPNMVAVCGLLPPQAFFDDAAGGSGGRLSAAELLRLAVEKLDLPRAVGRLVVKRAMQARTQAPPRSHAAPPEAYHTLNPATHHPSSAKGSAIGLAISSSVLVRWSVGLTRRPPS